MTSSLQDSILDPASAKVVVIAGFLGSVVSMNFVEGMTQKQRLVAIISGMVMSYYLTPLIAFLFSYGDYKAPIGFLVGLFGMSICAAIFRAIKSSDLWDLFSRRFSLKDNTEDKGI